jgi:uncharacterized protein YbjT (DUF2867 family)
MKPILVTGATGNVGRELAQLLQAGGSNLRAPQGVDAVFLVWVAPFAVAAPVIERIARHAEQIVLLTSQYEEEKA